MRHVRRFSSLSALCNQIKHNGPITVADFMRQSLRHPLHGYYSSRTKDIGSDFVTSPQVSSFLGEILGVWSCLAWKAMGQPSKFHFIELGPGSGLLAKDYVSSFAHISKLPLSNISMSLVEISNNLKLIQKSNLSSIIEDICWFDSLNNIPNDLPTLVIAHEFFDALPVHVFKKVNGQWAELLVDIASFEDNQLNFVQSQVSSVPKACLPPLDCSRDHIEVCLEGASKIEILAKRAHQQKHACLIVDYGHNGDEQDTLRGYFNNRQVNILEHFGSCDVTADVDFSFLSKHGEDNGLSILGPIEQGHFLLNLGIDLRLKNSLALQRNSDKRNALLNAFKMLVGPSNMGSRFKVMCLSSPELILHEDFSSAFK